MRRAVVILGSTAAGLAALFSYKTHVAGIAVASTSPATPTVSASPTTSLAGGSSASPAASASPSKTAPKTTPKTTRKAATAAAMTPTTTAPTTHAAAPTTAAPSETPTTAPSKKPTSSPAPTAAKTTAPAGPSGTFTGSSEDTQYGPVQVQITVANGKITNADGSLPQGGDSIGQNAIPQLNQEVLTAQGANIQAVSGATYTSQGYIQSLQQAVDKAGL
jgi:uncharacterized protein with FMN-binding domain